MHEAGRSVVGAVAVAGAMSLAGEAAATVSSTLRADRYLVLEGSGLSRRVYSVLDIYVLGNHPGDIFGGVFGLNGTPGHPVIFATSEAQGVTRDPCGRITGGTITSDIFVQAGNSSWNPTYSGSEAWDSFIAAGNRKQSAKVTNRLGTLIDFKSATWGTSTTFGAGQMNTANSNFIENGGGSGWFNTLGSNAYTNAGSAENPFARVSLYNTSWNMTYPDLYRIGLLVSKGQLVDGAACAAPAITALPVVEAGSSLDFCWMVGRFAIDVTGRTSPVTMQVQFNMVGKNGTGNETGTTFTGATMASYRVSQFFAFAMPPSCPSDLDGNNLVDPADISLLLLDFGPCAGCPSDLDGSGTTDTADLSMLLLDFGACP